METLLRRYKIVLELLTTFSPMMILMCCIMIFLAAKSVIEYKKWAVKTADEAYEKRHQVENLREQACGITKQHNEQLKQISGAIATLQATVDKLSDKVATLTESDRDDIKAWIVQQHHYFCYQKKSIDDFTMDTIERRFKHYQDEGGNSYVEDLMRELRALPKGRE